jgi:hypothetical protein
MLLPQTGTEAVTSPQLLSALKAYARSPMILEAAGEFGGAACMGFVNFRKLIYKRPQCEALKLERAGYTQLYPVTELDEEMALAFGMKMENGNWVGGYDSDATVDFDPPAKEIATATTTAAPTTTGTATAPTATAPTTSREIVHLYHYSPQRYWDDRGTVSDPYVERCRLRGVSEFHGMV